MWMGRRMLGDVGCGLLGSFGRLRPMMVGLICLTSWTWVDGFGQSHMCVPQPDSARVRQPLFDVVTESSGREES